MTMADAFSRFGAFARFFSVPYVDGGRDAEKDGGLDCWGFFLNARRELGLSVPPLHLVCGEDETREEWEREMASPKWRELPAPEPFCLVLLVRPGRPYHCGIVLDDCVTFAHLDRFGFHFCKLDSPLHRMKEKRYYRYED